MLSQEIQLFAKSAWEQARPELGAVGASLQARLEQERGEVRVLLELALGTLPASDVASVPLEALAGFARHALFLRENSPYCRDIPEDIFLHCVFYPRVNSEDLVDCRRFFYDMVAPVTASLPGKKAVLAVNRWCAAQMTYETTDDRSINPVTAYFCGLGRCGEESTFAVTALRSVGIPARQIYVPWWSHCDDNHAWVEAYVEGAWHFLGACEPEPVLDRGWFNSASSRAMLVCSRNFFAFVGEGLREEALTQRQGICLMYNQTRRYAATARVTVAVTDRAGKPLQGAWVRFYVLNMAGPARIAALETDGAGRVTLETGLGSCLLEAEADGLFAWEPLTVTGDADRTLTVAQQQPEEGCWQWDFFAPGAGQKNRSPLSAEQAREKAAVLENARTARRERIAGYWKPEYRTGDPTLDQVFRKAGGNAKSLWQFYKTYGKDAGPLLLSLASKDWRDAKPEVLQAHLEGARTLPGREKPEFLPHVQCPRIGFELLTDWRSPVLARLTDGERDRFRREPKTLWAWIQENFPEKNCRWQPVLWLQPGAALALGASDQKGRRLLFVAILRTLGVPARLNPVDGRAQFWNGTAFVTVEAAGAVEELGDLTVRFSSPLVYGQDWTLARWQRGWQTLDLATQTGPAYRLPLGLYRLITVNRLPNGNQLARLTTFRLETGGAAVEAVRREAEPEQMLARHPVSLPEAVPVNAALPKGLRLQLYLEVGTEPTEHVLNELLDFRTRVRESGLGVALLIPGPESLRDPALGKVLQALPELRVGYADFAGADLEALARALYLEPGLWPLTVLTDGSLAYYGHAGYAVGTIPLALNLAGLAAEA